MRIRYAVVLCILMLNLTLGPRHASGLEGAGHALALEVVFRTDSDWSILVSGPLVIPLKASEGPPFIF